MRPDRSILTGITAVAVLAITLLLALPLFAQGPGHRPAGPPGGPPGTSSEHDSPGGRLLAKLALYLDLDDAQKAQAQQIFADARAQAEPIREANHNLAGQLHEALAADPPDPTAVGNLAIEIHANREQLRGIGETARTSFRAILTEEQRLRLDALRDARRIFGHRYRGHRGDDPEGGDEGEPAGVL